MLVCVSSPPGRRPTVTENPLYHKSRMVTRTFREIFGGRVKISGKFRGVGFGPQNFRKIFDHRKFRHKSCKEVKILLSSADRTPTDMSLAWPDADRLKRRKPPYQLMAALRRKQTNKQRNTRRRKMTILALEKKYVREMWMGGCLPLRVTEVTITGIRSREALPVLAFNVQSPVTVKRQISGQHALCWYGVQTSSLRGYSA
jgi:hypothetical protein